MAFAFTLPELRAELRSLGHDNVPDEVIFDFLCQLNLPPYLIPAPPDQEVAPHDPPPVTVTNTSVKDVYCEDSFRSSAPAANVEARIISSSTGRRRRPHYLSPSLSTTEEDDHSDDDCEESPLFDMPQKPGHDTDRQRDKVPEMSVGVMSGNGQGIATTTNNNNKNNDDDVVVDDDNSSSVLFHKEHDGIRINATKHPAFHHQEEGQCQSGDDEFSEHSLASEYSSLCTDGPGRSQHETDNTAMQSINRPVNDVLEIHSNTRPVKDVLEEGAESKDEKEKVSGNEDYTDKMIEHYWISVGEDYMRTMHHKTSAFNMEERKADCSVHDSNSSKETKLGFDPKCCESLLQKVQRCEDELQRLTLSLARRPNNTTACSRPSKVSPLMKRQTLPSTPTTLEKKLQDRPVSSSILVLAKKLQDQAASSVQISSPHVSPSNDTRYSNTSQQFRVTRGCKKKLLRVPDNKNIKASKVCLHTPGSGQHSEDLHKSDDKEEETQFQLSNISGVKTSLKEGITSSIQSMSCLRASQVLLKESRQEREQKEADDTAASVPHDPSIGITDEDNDHEEKELSCRVGDVNDDDEEESVRKEASICSKSSSDQSSNRHTSSDGGSNISHNSSNSCRSSLSAQHHQLMNDHNVNSRNYTCGQVQARRGGKIDRVARYAEMQRIWKKDAFLKANDGGGKRKLQSFHRLFANLHSNSHLSAPHQVASNLVRSSKVGIL